MKNMECIATDQVGLTSREFTAEGFMVAPATLARTGVQRYLGRELGLTGADANEIIRLYRPPEEVFAAGALDGMNNKPITHGHPPGNWVTAENWKKVAVGDVQQVSKADETRVTGRVFIRDKAAVDGIKAGKTAMSVGYRFELDPTPGVTADGQEYDGVQRKIQPNHIAIVDVARGGPLCRIADSQLKEKTMIKLTVDSIPIEVDETAAGVVQKLQKQAADSATALTEAKTKLALTVKVGDAVLPLSEPDKIQTAIDAMAAKVVTPEQHEARVQARIALVGDAQKLVADYKADGKSDLQICREVLVTVKDEAPKAVLNAVLNGTALDKAELPMLVTAIKDVLASGSSKAQVVASDGALSAALTGRTIGTVEDKPSGRDAFIQRQNEAWRGVKSA